MAGTTLTDRLFDDADTAAIDPCSLFEEWFALAQESEANDPHAMALASVDEHGMPDVRMVLLNARDGRGYCFFTNFESDKGRQLHAHPKAALLLHWKSIRRQVRIRGPVEVVSPEEADAYFASRAKGSQIASSVSDQSRVLDSRMTLLNRVTDLATSVDDGPVSRPPHWSGFRVVPTSIEFWKDGEFRLHDRVRFIREGDGWTSNRLYP